MSVHKNIIWSSAIVAVLFGFGWTAPAEAQWRGRGPVRRVVVVGGGFYDPFWYGDPFFDYGYQWGPYGPYSPYRYYNMDPGASVRLEVRPKEAEVYVDGYYAGIVDDFNGVFQRLSITPGDHEIELYLEGYKTVRQKLLLRRNNTFKLKYDMQRLAAGEQPEPRPEPVNPPQMAPGGGQPPMPGQRQPGGLPPMPGPRSGDRPMPPPPQQPGDPRSQPGDPRSQPGNPRGGQDPRGGPPSSAYGTLAVRVQPGDAEVSIDGENWRGPDGRDRLVVEVAEGSHTVEIRKSGYRTYVTQVDVRRGQTTPLNVSLRSQDEQ